MSAAIAAAIPIAALFEMARREARKTKMEEYRAATTREESVRKAEEERAAREEGIERMRSITGAQLMAHLSGSDVPPGLMVPRKGAGVTGRFMSPFVPQLVGSVIAR